VARCPSRLHIYTCSFHLSFPRSRRPHASWLIIKQPHLLRLSRLGSPDNLRSRSVPRCYPLSLSFTDRPRLRMIRWRGKLAFHPNLAIDLGLVCLNRVYARGPRHMRSIQGCRARFNSEVLLAVERTGYSEQPTTARSPLPPIIFTKRA
jgi:hypothetical protein